VLVKRAAGTRELTTPARVRAYHQDGLGRQRRLAKDPEALLRSTPSFRAADRAAIPRTMMSAAPAAILEANTEWPEANEEERRIAQPHRTIR
jgi:hypothetical protein